MRGEKSSAPPPQKTTNKTQPQNFKLRYESLRASQKQKATNYAMTHYGPLENIKLYFLLRASRKYFIKKDTFIVVQIPGQGVRYRGYLLSCRLLVECPGQGVRYRGYLLSCRLLVECVGWYTNTFGATPVLGHRTELVGVPKGPKLGKGI